MTEKQYKLEQWSSLSLYYSFPDGNLHHSIGKVIARVENDLNSLYNENEQLKSVIKKVIELLSDEVDVFSEKATEHDIIAYVEFKELDNKDAFYMATATKKAIKILKRCLNE